MATTEEFGSVLVYGEKILLTSVKAVSPEYPLRGNLRIAETLYGEDRAVDAGPPPGEIWVDRRVLNRLALPPDARVNIGLSEFRVSGVVNFEPDRGGDFFNLAPRVLMNRADLEATAVVQPGSRVRYSFLFAGAAAQEMAAWLEPQLGPEQRMMNVKSERGSASRALRNAEHYLRLISLMAVVLAAVAIAVAAQRYSERHYDVSAMLRCLGAAQQKILAIYLGQLLMIAAAASAAGSVIGWMAQSGLVLILSDILPAGLPPSGVLQPLGSGFLTGCIILLGTALPPLLRIKEVSPLRVIRRNLAPLPLSAWMVYVAAAAAVGLIILMLSEDVLLTLVVFLVVAAMALLLFFLVYLVIRSNPGRMLRRRSLLGRGMAALVRRARGSSGQIIAFAVTLMMMLVIVMLRSELLDNWRTQLPADVPNYFAFNILPSEQQRFQQALANAGIAEQPIYPMVRGRLVEVNGEPVKPQTAKQDQTEEALNRELNLTWTAELPSDNRIVEGNWWTADATGRPLVSVEQELAGRLNLALGDRLTFNIGGRELAVTIASLRTVEWESFSPNFYMIFPPGVLDTMPATYITSFRLEGDGNPVVADLVREFPSVTVLEVEVIIRQLRVILQQVTAAVEVMLLFVLLAGFAVLFAAVQSSLDERLREGALMRALGARRRYLVRNNLTNLPCLAPLAVCWRCWAPRRSTLICTGSCSVSSMPQHPGPGF